MIEKSTHGIPFNRPCFQGKELVYVAQAIDSGHIAGDGSFTKRCNRFFEDSLGVYKALLTTSCTHALEMSALLLDLKPSDEIIVPSYTFVTTVNAFVVHGAKPVFIDCRRDTLNMDETQLEALITPRTRAIVPVHYAGVGCEMDIIMAIAEKHGLLVIEDTAHALLAKYKGRMLGSIGAMATLSFHETKNVICGEGGALLINDERFVERAEIIREKGTNRSRFFRGQVDKYSWVDVGSSYLPSEVLAAFLYGQLEQIERIQLTRRRIWEYYADSLGDWAAQHGVGLPFIPVHCDQAFHMFYLIMPSLEARQALIEHLKQRQIMAVFHYLPLHDSEMGRKVGAPGAHCPVTMDISDRILRLPFFNDMNRDDQERVIAAIHEFNGI